MKYSVSTEGDDEAPGGIVCQSLARETGARLGGAIDEEPTGKVLGLDQYTGVHGNCRGVDSRRPWRIFAAHLGQFAGEFVFLQQLEPATSSADAIADADAELANSP